MVNSKKQKSFGIPGGSAPLNKRYSYLRNEIFLPKTIQVKVSQCFNKSLMALRQPELVGHGQIFTRPWWDMHWVGHKRFGI